MICFKFTFISKIDDLNELGEIRGLLPWDDVENSSFDKCYTMGINICELDFQIKFDE
jgi:hypothetical protein